MDNVKEYLEKIENIKSITEDIAKESKAFAEFVIDKMSDAGIRSLCNGKLLLKIDYYKSAGQLADKLFLDTGDQESQYGNAGDLESSVIATDEGRYVWGDTNCWLQYPTLEEVQLFSELAPEIIKELASYGEKTDNNFNIEQQK